jgi:hypothetical protein
LGGRGSVSDVVSNTKAPSLPHGPLTAVRPNRPPVPRTPSHPAPTPTTILRRPDRRRGCAPRPALRRLVATGLSVRILRTTGARRVPPRGARPPPAAARHTALSRQRRGAACRGAGRPRRRRPRHDPLLRQGLDARVLRIDRRPPTAAAAGTGRPSAPRVLRTKVRCMKCAWPVHAMCMAGAGAGGALARPPRPGRKLPRRVRRGSVSVRLRPSRAAVQPRALPTSFHAPGTTSAASASFSASPTRNGVSPQATVCPATDPYRAGSKSPSATR